MIQILPSCIIIPKENKFSQIKVTEEMRQAISRKEIRCSRNVINLQTIMRQMTTYQVCRRLVLTQL